MAKKRQSAKQLFKPPQTAHHLPVATGAASSPSRTRSVNEILAGLRRSGGGSTAGDASAMASYQHTLPPEVRRILRLPELPAPRSRPVAGMQGRRLPPGPPPPRSWVDASARRHGDGWPGSLRGSVSGATGSSHLHARADAYMDPLPGAYVPCHGSLADMALRCMAREWDFQASYNRYHLCVLPSRLRVSLIRYVGLWGARGITAQDLSLVLSGPPAQELLEFGIEESQSASNDDVTQLDLSGSVGRWIRVKDVMDVLFPSGHASDPPELSESWETAPLPGLLPMLLPNLTHLSLGLVAPLGSSLPDSGGPVEVPSWHELLTFAPKLSALTHLGLAHWPMPSRSQIVSLAGVAPLSRTGHSSHMLLLDDEDLYSEAIIMMRQLARSLYRLEHLDLTGCARWCVEALTRADGAGNRVDWAHDWGQMKVLRVAGGEVGREIRSVALAPVAGGSRMTAADADRVAGARRIERHVILRRGGRGRPMTVETDWEEDALSVAMGGPNV